MSGISMIMNTAKLAIAAQQYGLNVTGHNIANVNSPHYSRQSVTHSATDPVLHGDLWFGTGVETTSITRACNQFLENRLIDLKSSLASYEETSAYMDILESAFNENTDSSLSNIMAEFWNTWQDLSNRPSGSPERLAVYEKGKQLVERFDSLSTDLLQIEIDVNSEITAVISEVGSLAAQIANINNAVIGQTDDQVAHDMFDERNALVTKIAQLVDVNTFEQSDGSLSVTTAGGFNLVTGAEAYELHFEDNAVKWENSYGSKIDITDKLTGGKIHGWLEMRDELISKYRAELDALAKEFIWTVNYQHSQGVGLKYFDSAVTGTYATDSTGMFSTLDFGNKIDYTEDFKMWIEDTSGATPTYTFVTVDMGLSDANPTYTGTFNTPDTTYTINIIQGGVVGTNDIVFTWSETGGGFGGPLTMTAPATSIAIDGCTLGFTADDTLVAGNTLRINTVDDGFGKGAVAEVSLTPTGTANSILDTYKFTVTSGGLIGTDTIAVSWSNSVTSGSFTLDKTTEASVDASVDGMTLTFVKGGYFFTGDEFVITTDSDGDPTEALMSDWHWTLDSFVAQFNRDAGAAGVTAEKTSANKVKFTPATDKGFAFSDDGFTDSGVAAALGFNTFFTGADALAMGVNSLLSDTDYIAAAQLDSSDGTFGVGDNRNAIAIANLKHSTRNIVQWTYSRGSDATSTAMSYSLEDYTHAMVGSIGIKAASMDRYSRYTEEIVDKVTRQRDNISAVSLDEEMINLMKYQHAFSVASKLLTVSDELLNLLIQSKR
ncbi:MAG: flagellar hook-associated protein FlgK [Deltaproteobacteria bacterium]|nr:flagellar hook-associated protein FlgK [Deltaproteobacteria bacterium]